MEKDNARQLAQFLYESPLIDKASVGNFIGKNKEFNKQVLSEYIRLFEHKDVDFLTVLRAFLESFIIPGESPIIQRILEYLATEYYSTNSKNESFGFNNEDAVFLVAYALVILNVDQHSGKVPKPMEESVFVRQLKGTNGKENFDLEMIKSIYRRVCANEIRLKEPYFKGPITSHRWRVLLERSQHTFSLTYHSAFSR